MMEVIKQQLYKIKRYYGATEFVQTDSLDELAKYVATKNKAGDIVSSVTAIHRDGTTPRIAIAKLDAYKKAMKEPRTYHVSVKVEGRITVDVTDFDGDLALEKLKNFAEEKAQDANWNNADCIEITAVNYTTNDGKEGEFL